MSNSPRPQYFNPRPPRGGRRNTGDRGLGGGYFNPRPPRGGRPAGAVGWRTSCQISIHALREEGDFQHKSTGEWDTKFQSTPSARRATSTAKQGGAAALNFNPRPPRGGRPSFQGDPKAEVQFQSTPSARRATGSFDKDAQAKALFQSTPSARRATCSLLSALCATINFNPRPPRGGRR